MSNWWVSCYNAGIKWICLKDSSAMHTEMLLLGWANLELSEWKREREREKLLHLSVPRRRKEAGISEEADHLLQILAWSQLVTPSGLSIVHAIHLFIFLFKEWSHLLFSICICPLQREGCVGKGWIDRLGQITNVLNPGLQLLRPAELRSISFQNGLSH